jgi:4-alpha-glucanotransferase
MSELQTLLDELARRRGLGEAYYDYRGELRHFSAPARRAILQAMGVPVDDADAIRVDLSTPPDSASEQKTTICYQPAALETQRCWGFSVQLYTLRSAGNWGIGDFGDLRELIELVAPLGCAVIGLNPLHALFPAEPLHSSPYSPSSRLFLNALYISIEDVPEFALCAPLQALCAQTPFQMALAGVRGADNVMYEQVATLKLCALRLLYSNFLDTHAAVNSSRAQEFDRFIADRGESLRLHALFDALDAHFRAEKRGGWRTWSEEYRDAKSRAVEDFAEEYAHDVKFYAYLQWLADAQLGNAQSLAREKGMHIGLYGDLAVGANPDGSEVWSNQALYVHGASIGAPPDPLALSGQDWGIPPIDPHALHNQAHRPFVELLHANMHRVGALRIDHVMSLFRLWWVPKDFGAVEGVYVHYPLAVLVELLAQESTRAKCLVIGEDLGTVPDEIRRAMETRLLYHYKVLLFEKLADGRFKAPAEYTRHAVATATTHDLPPLKAWWQGDDLSLRDRLNLYPSVDTAHRLHDERTIDRRALLNALREAGLWQWQDHEPPPEFSHALARAIHLYLGESQAALVLMQLEDLIDMTDPVNVPGTHTEHANWQRKLTATTHDIFTRPEVLETLAAVGVARTDGIPKAQTEP